MFIIENKNEIGIENPYYFETEQDARDYLIEQDYEDNEYYFSKKNYSSIIKVKIVKLESWETAKYYKKGAKVKINVEQLESTGWSHFSDEEVKAILEDPDKVYEISNLFAASSKFPISLDSVKLKSVRFSKKELILQK